MLSLERIAEIGDYMADIIENDDAPTDEQTKAIGVLTAEIKEGLREYTLLQLGHILLELCSEITDRDAIKSVMLFDSMLKYAKLEVAVKIKHQVMLVLKGEE
jgi:hypothetical protein